jgi:predicted esterase
VLVKVVASVAMFAAFAYASWRAASAIGAHRLASDHVATECLGDPAAPHHVVYLHGIDSFGPSWQELENRRTLARLADAKDLAIAIPRSPVVCPQLGGRCWPQDSREALHATGDAIRAAARACFDDDAHLGVIGFSNGGFAVARMYQTCVANVDWFIVASAGGFAGNEVPELSACGRIAITIGTRDRYHFTYAHELDTELRARHADVELVEFDGGHRLDFDALMQSLQMFARHE